MKMENNLQMAYMVPYFQMAVIRLHIRIIYFVPRSNPVRIGKSFPKILSKNVCRFCTVYIFTMHGNLHDDIAGEIFSFLIFVPIMEFIGRSSYCCKQG